MEALWSRHLTNDHMRETFTFDPDARDYDALAVYEDLPPLDGDRKILRREPLACPRSHTLLFVTEPSSIRLDGLHYLAQFGRVVTSRPFSEAERAFLMERGTTVDPEPCLVPFYGRDMDGDAHLSLADIAAEAPEKTEILSTVTSTKAMDHTVHARRQAFVQEMKARLGDTLTLFGRGIRDIRDKREGMVPFRYHIAIENHYQSGHYTEKLTDCFLARCLPFYFGDPDYAERFPRDAVIPIDIFDADRSEHIIREAISTDQYAARREALEEARSLALLRADPLLRTLQWAKGLPSVAASGEVILGRHAFRRAHPVLAARDALYSARMRRSPLADPLQGYRSP